MTEDSTVLCKSADRLVRFVGIVVTRAAVSSSRAAGEMN